MASSDPLLNKKLGDYTIQNLLGKGGMARVYRGYDEKLDRYAAIKVISGDFASADEEEYKERFLKEARAIARLSHPNIVGIYQFGDAEGVYYMAMHFLDGDDLRTILRRYAKKNQEMPQEQFVKMGRDMAEALDYAHREGVVHRDIKPSNIMMTIDGRAVLTDFGLALSVPEGTMGDTFGTAHYIAPEQAISSANAVPQSDLYSLAVVFYEVLTGQVPFDEPSAMSVALKHLNEPPPPPSLLNPDIPRPVEKVLLKALSKNPADRYQTGKALMDALEESFAAAPGVAEPATTPTVVPPPAALHPVPNSLENYLKTLEESAGTPPSPPSQPVPPGYASDMRSPTDMQPPYMTSPYPPSMLYPPQPHRSNTWLIVAVVGILVLVAAVLAYLIMSNQDDNKDSTTSLVEAQLTLNAVNRSETQTTEALFTDTPTPTDTNTPTNTPTPTDTPTFTPTFTDTPTATFTSTFTATYTDTATFTATYTDTATFTATYTDTPTFTATYTDTPTHTATFTPTDEPASPTPSEEPTEVVLLPPTDVPSPTPTPIPPNIRLVYNDVSFIIMNITEANLDIRNLVFRLETEEGTRELELGDAFDPNELAALPPQGCLQLVVATGVATDTSIWTNVCRRLAWNAPGAAFIFWVSDVPSADVFTISFVRGTREVELASCPLVLGIEDVTCEFSTQARPPSSSSSSPTEVAIVEVAATPTLEVSPSATATEETDVPPSATPTTEASLELVYTDNAVYLHNISTETQAISGLRFEQTSAGQTRSFRASDWGNSLRPNFCYQLGVNATVASTKPAACQTLEGWLVRTNENSQFWRELEGGSDTFTVYNGDIKVVDCEIQAGRCPFSLE